MNYYEYLILFGIILIVVIAAVAMYFCKEIIDAVNVTLAFVICMVALKLGCDIYLHSSEPVLQREDVAYESNSIYNVYEKDGCTYWTDIQSNKTFVIKSDVVEVLSKEPTVLNKYYVKAYVGTPLFYSDSYTIKEQYVFQ